MEERLRSAGLEFTIVEALDATELTELPKGTLTPKGLYAIWVSHARAMGALVQDGGDYGLILEDDAVLDHTMNWNIVNQDVRGFMCQNKFDFLQLGHIAAAYKDGALRTFARNFRGERFPQWQTKLNSRSVRILEGTTRAGMNAYVISRELAETLPSYNEPVWMGPNGFLERFASAALHLGAMRLGTVIPSLVEQESRQSVGAPIDSDNLP